MRLHYNAQDDLHSQGQHLTVLRSDQGWGNNSWNTRYSEHDGPRDPTNSSNGCRSDQSLIRDKRNLVTAKLGLRPQCARLKLGQTFGCLLSLVLSRRNNNIIYLETSTSRPLQSWYAISSLGTVPTKDFQRHLATSLQRFYTIKWTDRIAVGPPGGE